MINENNNQFNQNLQEIIEKIELFGVYITFEKFIYDIFKKNNETYYLKKRDILKTKEKYIIFLGFNKNKNNEAFFHLTTTQDGCSKQCKVCSENKCFEKCHSFPKYDPNQQIFYCCKNYCNILCKIYCSKNHPEKKCYQRVFIHHNEKNNYDVYLDTDTIIQINLEDLALSITNKKNFFEKWEYEFRYKHLIFNHISNKNWKKLFQNTTCNIYKEEKNKIKCLYWKKKI